MLMLSHKRRVAAKREPWVGAGTCVKNEGLKPFGLATTLIILAHFGCAEGQGFRMAAKAFSRTPAGPLIIAHRGGSLEAPENTIASVSHGVSVGSDWQEVDVTLTADGVLVVIHDDTLERTTLATGLVEEKRWDEIAGLSVGAPRWSDEAEARLRSMDVSVPRFEKGFASERVPTLEQILRVPGVRLMIELKKTTRAAALAQATVKAVQAAKMQQRVAIGSFAFDVVEAAYRADPSIPLIGIVDDPKDIATMLRLPIAILAVDKAMLAQALAQAPKGVAVWVWTAYHLREAQTPGRRRGGRHHH